MTCIAEMAFCESLVPHVLNEPAQVMRNARTLRYKNSLCRIQMVYIKEKFGIDFWG